MGIGSLPFQERQLLLSKSAFRKSFRCNDDNARGPWRVPRKEEDLV